MFVGIIGGMGPLASAEFLKTIYEYSNSIEQNKIETLLLSLPNIPDRTKELDIGRTSIIESHLKKNISILKQLKVSHIVICCFTAHLFLSRIPDFYLDKVISLIDFSVQFLSSEEPTLFLCSRGLSQFNVCELASLHSRDCQTAHLLDEKDQHILHKMIYRYKLDASATDFEDFLTYCSEKYKIKRFIMGCTELHPISKCYLKRLNTLSDLKLIDPLCELAFQLNKVHLASLDSGQEKEKLNSSYVTK